MESENFMLNTDLDLGIPLKAMNDQGVFNEEIERIFSNNWIFLGFMDEVLNPGDFVVRRIGLNSIIVARGEDGKIRAFFNACRHMGTELCEAEFGRVSTFTCPYHGWTYNNMGKLVGVPVKDIAYKRFKFSDVSLYEIKIDTYENLIFGNLGSSTQSLSDYLGETRWYLDIFFKASGGMKIVGKPIKFIADFDWKSGASNFAEDRLHTITTHRSVVELGYASPISRFGYVTPGLSEITACYLNDSLGRPVGAFGMRFPPDESIPGFFGFYGDHFREHLKPDGVSEDQFKIFQRVSHWVGTIFPNLSFFTAADQTDKSGKPNSPVSLIRLWQPLGPGKTEVWTWVVVPRVLPDEIAKRVYEVTTSHFGPSGVAEMDDTSIWRRISKSASGNLAKKISQLIIGGLDSVSDLPVLRDWRGPGLVRPTQFHEDGPRTFWRRWLMEMGYEVKW
ncbi:2Fe-2S ferredoxin [Sulfolobus acidocaldarius SUSAZ]|nr:2Fe-2S ferredoxin [Sulfolobus acidocaldarius SUSAZ]